MRRKTPRPGSPRWWQSRAPQDEATQRRPGRPSLPVGRVIDAAVQLVDEVGPGRFSMRMLAQRLRSSTATLYRNFKSKDEILVHVVDHVLGEVPRHLAGATDASMWQERLITAADALFRTLKEHPNVVPLLDHHVPLGPHALAAREAVLGILLAGGFPPKAAARAYTTVGRYIIGFASQLRGASGREEDEDIRAFYQSLDRARYPATLTSAPFLPRSLEEEFRFGLRLIVSGLAEHLTHPAARARAR